MHLQEAAIQLAPGPLALTWAVGVPSSAQPGTAMQNRNFAHTAAHPDGFLHLQDQRPPQFHTFRPACPFPQQAPGAPAPVCHISPSSMWEDAEYKRVSSLPHPHSHLLSWETLKVRTLCSQHLAVPVYTEKWLNGCTNACSLASWKLLQPLKPGPSGTSCPCHHSSIPPRNSSSECQAPCVPQTHSTGTVMLGL